MKTNAIHYLNVLSILANNNYGLSYSICTRLKRGYVGNETINLNIRCQI